MTESKPGEFERVCLNPKAISPDDLDDVILGRMIKKGKQQHLKGKSQPDTQTQDSFLGVVLGFCCGSSFSFVGV